MSLPPARIFYKISELSEIIGVETHVLRFWEKEFPQIKPLRMSGKKRLYRPRDMEIFLEIKNLLYEERFTIEGARKRLELKDFKQRRLFKESDFNASDMPSWKIDDFIKVQEKLDQLRQGLLDIKELIIQSFENGTKDKFDEK